MLSRHILVDGYHVVMDMERSQGSYLYDARSDRPILDFFSCFATIVVLPVRDGCQRRAQPRQSSGTPAWTSMKSADPGLSPVGQEGPS